MSLFLIAALPFLGALFPALLIRAGRNASASSAGLATGLAFIGLMLHAPAILRGEVVQVGIDWLPALGLSANFFLDGLGFLFATLILGIGLPIRFYLRNLAQPVDTCASAAHTWRSRSRHNLAAMQHKRISNRGGQKHAAQCHI